VQNAEKKSQGVNGVLMSESPIADRGGGVLAPAGSRVEAGPLKDFCVH